MPRISKTYQCAKNAKNMTNLPVCQGAKPSVPWVMTPTRVGTRMPGMVASMFVMAIRVPEMGVSDVLTFGQYLQSWVPDPLG